MRFAPKAVPGIWRWPLTTEVEIILLLICSKIYVPEFPPKILTFPSPHLPLLVRYTCPFWASHSDPWWTIEKKKKKKAWSFVKNWIEWRGKKEVRYHLDSALIIPWFDLTVEPFAPKNRTCQLAWSLILLLAFMWQNSQGSQQNAIHSLEAWWVLERSVSSTEGRSWNRKSSPTGRWWPAEL